MGNNTIAGFRLSAQQERLWSLQSGPETCRAQCAVLVEGPVQSVRLQQAVQKVVSRHEILRTVFQKQSGMRNPFQVIRDSSEVVWKTVEVRGSSEIALTDTIKDLCRKQADFDLEKGPTLHVQLATLSSEKHTLLLDLPALCADVRSLHNLVAEIGGAYAASGQCNDVSDEVMQYADVVEWQNALLEGEDTKAGRDFWRDYFRKIDFATLSRSLPFELTPEQHAFEREVVEKPLDFEQVSRIDALCSPYDVSPEDLLFACFNVMLWRITGHLNIVVGCEFDGRKYEELQDALGLFAKYPPLQAHIEPELPFSKFLVQIQNSTSEARKWQESFTWDQMENSSDRSGTLLPFTFAYSELPAKQTYGDVEFSIVRQDVCGDGFTLKLSALRSASGLTLEFEYDRARLQPAWVEGWAGYFCTLLAAAVDHPEMAISRLPLLSPAEQRQLLVEWNQTAAAYPQDRCLHELFEAQAARTPERPALRFEEQELSYRELNEQTNQLAHYLRRLGVGPDSLVGLCLERSAEMMVALLAILKAGGAYVPLNADNPKPRLSQQLSGARVLITQQKLLPQMPEFAGTTLSVDRDQSLWATEPRSNPQVRSTPENLVYVIYTSGSTGVPKGVAVRHRNLVNYTHFIQQRLELGKYPEGLHFATVSTLGADLGNTCIYPALIAGGCLHVISYSVSTDSQRFATYTRQYPIDVLKIVPSHLQALLDSAEARQVLPRKYLILGGETLSPQLVEKIQNLDASCEILNHYGPTETTVGSLTLRLKEFDQKEFPISSIPIGRPMANTQIYILDAHQQAVPVGVGGELYIAGAGVAAGYLNQAERTAERFLPNPFVDNAQARMYRTGDLARYLPDGNVEFLGRADDQVKIRGFRVELGEIESVLRKHPAVKQAVVLTQPDPRGDQRLLAYVVGHRDSQTSADQLRALVKEQLPDYMVPAAIVLLAKLPLTPNGKIDRQALPAPEQAPINTYIPPRTPTEEVLANIWAQVLRLDRVGAHDDFFQIGGHSLLATQVISRLHRTLQVDLSLRTLFEYPTVAKLAQQIENARAGNEGLLAPPITRVSRDQELPLSYAQQRLWVLDQIEPNNPLYNIARALRIVGPLNVEALEKSLNEIIRRHESQRTTFSVSDAKPIQVIARALIIHLPVRDLTSLSDARGEIEASRIAGEEAQTPFDLAQGPLVRATLLKVAANEHVLLLTMHHIVSDAWSAGVFLQELSELYEAFSAGKPSPLPELAIQYADYSAWQRQWFQGEVLDKQLAYWREQLRGAPPVIQLPADRPRPSVQSFQGAYESVSLPENLLEPLKKLGQEEGVTLFMTLLAGFQALLSRHSGQEQIVIGTDLANRGSIETEKLIGFFINLLPLRTNLSGNPPFRELLGRVREVALGAYAHQDMPFDKLVEELQPDRSLSHNPLVQALFVMQNIPRPKRELAGLTLSAFEIPITRSKFDLAVFMVENDGRLIGNWLYSTDLFDRATILRMAGHFAALLQSAVAQPDSRLSALEILSEDEKLQRGSQTKERKQSQLKKLITVEPKAVTLSLADKNGKE